MSVFGERFLLPLTSGAVLILIFTNPMKWDWISRIVGAVIAIGIAAIVAYALQRGKAGKEDDPKKGRIYVPEEVTMESLVMRFRNDETQTSLQVKQSIQPYIGKWVRYTGVVSNVITGTIFFKSKAAYSYGEVEAHFDKKWQKHLDILPRGKTITIDGEIESLSAVAAMLGKCEFVEEEQP